MPTSSWHKAQASESSLNMLTAAVAGLFRCARERPQPGAAAGLPCALRGGPG
jgi:hypothetical protein